MKYGITIHRYESDESDPEEMFDRYIDADTAVTILSTLACAEDPTEEIDVVDEDEQEDEPEPETTPRPQKSTGGRKASYDKEAIIKDLQEGKLSRREIAEKHGIPNVQTIHNIYNKNKDLIEGKADGEVKERPATASPEQGEPVKPPGQPQKYYYDRDAVEADLDTGMTMAQIASKHGIPVSTVSTVKARRHDHSLPQVKCTKCDEWGHQANECKFQSPNPSAPHQDHRSLREKVKELWTAGLCIEEICDVFPSEEIVELNAIYQDLEHKRKD